MAETAATTTRAEDEREPFRLVDQVPKPDGPGVPFEEHPLFHRRMRIGGFDGLVLRAPAAERADASGVGEGEAVRRWAGSGRIAVYVGARSPKGPMKPWAAYVYTVTARGRAELDAELAVRERVEAERIVALLERHGLLVEGLEVGAPASRATWGGAIAAAVEAPGDRAQVQREALKRAGADLMRLRDEGVILEANRQLLHPLGLSLAVVLDEDGTTALRLQDHSAEHPGGVVFEELTAEDREHARRFEALRQRREAARLLERGFVVQPFTRRERLGSGPHQDVDRREERGLDELREKIARVEAACRRDLDRPVSLTSVATRSLAWEVLQVLGHAVGAAPAVPDAVPAPHRPPLPAPSKGAETVAWDLALSDAARVSDRVSVWSEAVFGVGPPSEER